MELELYTEIIAVAMVLFYLLGIASALEAIIKVRTAQGAIAWSISLLTVPYIAVPCYWVFGRNKFDGYLEQRTEIEQESEKLKQRTHGAVEQYIIRTQPDAPLYTCLNKLARMPATRGNNVDLLVNGGQTFDSIQAGLETAEKYILFQCYIIRDDVLGNRLGRVMEAKARSGVKVYLLYDEIGSRQFARSKLLRTLKQVGVQVAPFNTTQGRRRGRKNRFQLNFRNHRKIVIVDGQTAWIGGHNVGDEYLGLDNKVGPWRDTHTRVQGPAVLDAAITFATDWRWAVRTPLNIDWNFAIAPQGPCDLLVFPSNPASKYEEAGLMYHQLIVEARERIWIASPYFVPDRGIIAALQLAVLRGVDVRIIIPDKTDGRVVAMANWSYTRELLPVGVKIYRYKDGFMHQKVLLMDDHIAGVGTANFDNRSFRLNFEITLLVHNREFAHKVEKMLEADMRQSWLVTTDELDGKPGWFPLAMGIARLLSPLL
ncbi:MAG: cardiolipin synthase [Halieaceae bacterium]|jgi:cardiolipin synthase A/B|nr:cardiolipin synthase [Halieaceae bacterium]